MTMNGFAKAAVAVALVAASGSAIAAAPTDTGAPMLTCAGIGVEGRAASASAPHSLKMVYANGLGEYLGDVRTEISRAGAVVGAVSCDGPWLLAELPPGAYQVTASHDGELRSVTVTVPERGAAREVVRF